MSPCAPQVPTGYLLVAVAGPVAMSMDIWLGMYKALNPKP